MRNVIVKLFLVARKVMNEMKVQEEEDEEEEENKNKKLKTSKVSR